MTTRYVGPGGSNSNSGLTWAARKLTLNGVEATMAQGDMVWVAPGTYRETLAMTVSGTTQYVWYRADVDGSHTTGLPGIVRLAGTDNDQTTARSQAINGNNKNLRRFSGLTIDSVSSELIYSEGSQHYIIESCHFSDANKGIWCGHTEQWDWQILGCDFINIKGDGVQFDHFADVTGGGAHIVNDCTFIGMQGKGINFTHVDGVVNRCTIIGCEMGIEIASPPSGKKLVVRDSSIASCNTGMKGAGIDDDRNNVHNCNTRYDGTVTVGPNSTDYLTGFSGTDLIAGTRTEQNVDSIILQLASLTQSQIADAVLRRSFASAEASATGDTLSLRSLLGAGAKLTNKVAIGGSTLSIYGSDDTTVLGTQALTTSSSADPIVGVDTN